ncbi:MULTISPECIES: hypothetical protein [Bacteroidota]|uniref:hypothetical protein n=1 Tax=Bacteroidota TaxID=976 RepID=UPI002FD89A99
MDLVLLYVRSGELKILYKAQEFIIRAAEYAFTLQLSEMKFLKTEPYKDISLTLKPDTLQEVYGKVNSHDVLLNTIESKDVFFKLMPNADLISLFLSLEIYVDNNALPAKEIYRLKSLEGIYALLNNSEEFFWVLFCSETANQ